MNVKQFALKAIAPTVALVVLVASWALTALASFVVGTVPANCTSSYGYDAGYGYGYGYDTASCTTPVITSGGGGWGSSSSYSPPVTTTTTTPTTTTTVDTSTPDVVTPTESTDPTWIAQSVDGKTCNANSSSFNNESKSAYLYACTNNITTKRAIDDSIFYGILVRKEMAKMISNYAINVMGMDPDTSKACTFDDVAGEDAEMKKYITTACQLGLMGYKGDAVTKADSFSPNAPVSRAMFATLFSRMMYGTEYATAAGSSNWAGPSLDALKAAGILKNINWSLTEVRGYVWIVFDRANQ